MNEIDLKLKIEGLEKVIKEQQDSADSYKLELKKAQKELEDYNKPELTTFQLGAIEDLISNAIGDFNFDNQDLYEIEYGLDYDAKVFADNINFRDTYELTEAIVQAVTKFFKEVPNPDETDTSSGAFVIGAETN
tara:strand:+ start:177 stop:578 length:402 start_codon:yes stop_codon:yes gene_type:complete